MLKKLKNLILYLLFVGISSLLLLELSFRYYVVDFYGGTLKGLNKDLLITDSDQETILVIGDSFSAQQESYVGHLRTHLPDYRIINSAVPGTTISQHRLFTNKRIKAFQPDILIYQIYVGNDLLEYRHPTTGKGLSRLRKCYWWLADRLLVVGYLNARLPQLRKAIDKDAYAGVLTTIDQAFSPEKYNHRSKIQFQAEPDLLENSVLLKEKRGQDFLGFIAELKVLLQDAQRVSKVYVLVMPHCIQLGDPFLSRMQALGAKVDQPTAIQQLQYPFIQQLTQGLSSERVKIVNGLDYLRQAEFATEGLYFENDPHLTPAGQRIIGETLSDLLQEN